MIIEKKYAIVDSNLQQCEGRFREMINLPVVLDFDNLTWHWNESPVKYHVLCITVQQYVKWSVYFAM